MALYKTTLVIWSEYDTSELSAADIGREADLGDFYCSVFDIQYVMEPEEDIAFEEGMKDFFAVDDEESREYSELLWEKE